jgi:hypothetical protein
MYIGERGCSDAGLLQQLDRVRMECVDCSRAHSLTGARRELLSYHTVGAVIQCVSHCVPVSEVL